MREKSDDELERDRKMWREQKIYRQKQKNKPGKQTEKPKPSDNTGQKQKKNAKRRLTRLLERSKKQNAVLRTSAWRMKIYLKSQKSSVYSQTEFIGQDQNNGEDEQSEFRSRSTEQRAYVKAKSSLPTSPRRKSRIIEKLMGSPRTRQRLEKRE